MRDGEFAIVPESEVASGAAAGHRLLQGAGYPIQVPTIDIVEVGAGGGSIASVDAAGGFRVGPRSAGAVPGPVCYARGGKHPTVTDANLVLGYLNPETLVGGTFLSTRRRPTGPSRTSGNASGNRAPTPRTGCTGSRTRT